MNKIDTNEYKIYTSTKAPSELLPPRDSEGHKGTFGKVLLVAGSENMAGAAVLAAKAAYRTGAGMVKVISPECNRVIIQVAVPEALYMPSESNEDKWVDAFEWCDAIMIGSGLGTDENAKESLRKVMTMTNKPVVLDADALNIIAKECKQLGSDDISKDKSSSQYVQTIDKCFSSMKIFKHRKVILTPHEGELKRLATTLRIEYLDRIATSDVNKTSDNAESFESCSNQNKKDDLNRIATSLEISEKLASVVVSKSADTYVVSQSNNNIFLNDRGNSGMATAGSGDVLAGCIVALLGMGLDAFDAAERGVQLHALAGDYLARKYGESWIMAGDIADSIGVM